MTRHTFVLAAAALTLAACGGSTTDGTGGTPPAGQTVVVTTAPADSEVEPGASLRFTAQVTGTSEGGVTWAVVEAGGGSVDPAGVYTAPTTEGTFHVRAVSLASSKGTGTSVVRVKKGAVQPPVSVAVDPATATVAAGGTASFAAVVTGTNTRTVTWTVQEGSSCGAVTAAGVYTAPGAGATCHVVATSAADPTKSGSSTVTVTPPPVIAVSVAPGTASVLTGGSVTFVATVTGTSNTSVTWSVPAGAGTINASTGVYVAPATAGTYTVTATSVADGTKRGTATVTVTAPPPVIAVSVSPATTTLVAGGTATFVATVTGTSNTAVTWSVPAGAGTINASTGVYVAPATAGTYTVTATSVADGARRGTATVTVTAPPIAVAVNPTSVTLDACKGQVFTATVTNTSNGAVTWSVVEAGGGTVTNGAYVAPTSAGTYHVLVVSQADPTKTAQATITVGAERVLSVAVVPGSGTVAANGQLTFAANVTTTCGTFAAQ